VGEMPDHKFREIIFFFDLDNEVVVKGDMVAGG